MKSATRTVRTASVSASVLVVTSLLAVLGLLAGCSSSGGGGTAGAVDSGSPRSAASGSTSSTASASSTSSAASASSPAPTSAEKVSRVPTRPSYDFPVRAQGVKFGRYHHDYPATDIFAPCGSSVVAPTAGRITEVTRTDRWSSRTNTGATRGGLSVSIQGTDGVRYYGSHLRSIVASIAPGEAVAAGELLGQVGNTGDARGIACHLHFGISPPCGTADWWNRRGVLSPYRFLKSWQARGDLSPEPAVVTWRAEHGCPKAATVDR